MGFSTDPANPQVLMASQHYWGFYGKIFRFPDGDDTWKEITIFAKHADVPPVAIGLVGHHGDPAYELQ